MGGDVRGDFYWVLALAQRDDVEVEIENSGSAMIHHE